MNTLLILSSILVVLYTGAAIGVLRELPESISSMVYVLPKRWQWVWSAWMILVAITIMPPMLDALAGYDAESVGFLTTACLIGAAVTPIIQQETYRWHTFFGISAGIFSQAAVAFICPWLLSMWIPILVMLVSASRDGEGGLMGGKMTFFAETVCFLTLTLSLYTR